MGITNKSIVNQLNNDIVTLKAKNLEANLETSAIINRIEEYIIEAKTNVKLIELITPIKAQYQAIKVNRVIYPMLSKMMLSGIGRIYRDMAKQNKDTATNWINSQCESLKLPIHELKRQYLQTFDKPIDGINNDKRNASEIVESKLQDLLTIVNTAIDTNDKQLLANTFDLFVELRNAEPINYDKVNGYRFAFANCTINTNGTYNVKKFGVYRYGWNKTANESQQFSTSPLPAPRSTGNAKSIT